MRTAYAGVRLQLIINGVIKCTAGMERSGVIDATVYWSKQDCIKPLVYSASGKGPVFATLGLSRDEINVHLGGAKNDGDLSWYDNEVAIGDEIMIRILGPGPVDPPI